MREKLRSKRLLATLRGEAHITDEAYDATPVGRHHGRSRCTAMRVADRQKHFNAVKWSRQSFISRLPALIRVRVAERSAPVAFFRVS
jgi:hypothetical protein